MGVRIRRVSIGLKGFCERGRVLGFSGLERECREDFAAQAWRLADFRSGILGFRFQLWGRGGFRILWVQAVCRHGACLRD